MTDEQWNTFANLDKVQTPQVYFDGLNVVVYMWEEYQVTIYTIYPDGEYLKEWRGLDSDGWESEESNDPNNV